MIVAIAVALSAFGAGVLVGRRQPAPMSAGAPTTPSPAASEAGAASDSGGTAVATDGPTPADDALQDGDGPLLRRWTALNMAGGYTPGPADAEALARRTDLVVANAGLVDAQIATMRASNPDLEVLLYLNGTFAQARDAGDHPDAWYARDHRGRAIRSNGFGNVLMDPTATGWQRAVARRCTEHITAHAFDGCYLDMLGVAPLFKGYGTGRPIDPDTAEPWTPAAWLQATSSVARTVSSAMPSTAVVAGNGLGDGTRYVGTGSAGTRVLTDVLDAAVPELWLRRPHDPVSKRPDATEWREDVDMLIDAQRRGTAVLTLTRLADGAGPDEQAAWREFALASFLLATDGTSYFTFHGDLSPEAVLEDPFADVDPGRPAQPYPTMQQVDGVQQRTFSNGRAIVNPSDQPITVDVGDGMTDLAGAPTGRSITLPPRSGRVLLRG